MEFFVDTADINEIKRINDLGIFIRFDVYSVPL